MILKTTAGYPISPTDAITCTNPSQNSWGKKWGRNGYGTIPFKYVEALTDDFWTIRR